MQNFLRNGLHYDLLHSGQTADIDFYVAQAKRIGGPVLELCCGTGRVTIPIAQAGIEVVGLELLGPMLSRACEKAAAQKIDVEWVQGDATNFSLGRKFKLILCPFSSLQILGDAAAVRSFFSCVRAHLAPGGLLIFDVFNPNLNYLASELRRRRPEGSYLDPETGEAVTIEAESAYDDATQRTNVTFFFSTARQKDLARECLSQRCFYPEELNWLVESLGFSIVEKFGDFSGKLFASGDPKQVVVCAPNSSS